MTTYLIALEVETDATQGCPESWAWAELIDSPLFVGPVATIKTRDDAPVPSELRRLAHVLLNQADQAEHEEGLR